MKAAGLLLVLFLASLPDADAPLTLTVSPRFAFDRASIGSPAVFTYTIRIPRHQYNVAYCHGWKLRLAGYEEIDWPQRRSCLPLDGYASPQLVQQQWGKRYTFLPGDYIAFAELYRYIPKEYEGGDGGKVERVAYETTEFHVLEGSPR